MGRACSMHWRDENTYKMLVKNVKEGDHLEDLSVDRII
jgi:hypothetical protein